MISKMANRYDTHRRNLLKMGVGYSLLNNESILPSENLKKNCIWIYNLCLRSCMPITIHLQRSVHSSTLWDILNFSSTFIQLSLENEEFVI